MTDTASFIDDLTAVHVGHRLEAWSGGTLHHLGIVEEKLRERAGPSGHPDPPEDVHGVPGCDRMLAPTHDEAPLPGRGRGASLRTGRTGRLALLDRGQ